MRSDTTQPTAEPEGERGQRCDPEFPALVIAHCREEPWRPGEVALFPGFKAGTIGRKGVTFFQQRPSGNVEMPPLADRSIKREHLQVTPMMIGYDAGFHVVNRGAGEMRINGKVTTEGVVKVGGTVEIRGSEESKLLLYCTERPTLLRTRYLTSARGAFGEPDVYAIVGESMALYKLLDRCAFVAQAGFHTLLHGASGTGKELVARALHEMSRRAARAFVSRNAVTFTESLIDSELFGNAARYPNPGTLERPGLFGEADGGTLFLDEIAEMPLWLQSHLLRAVDPKGEYTRVGDSKPRRCDVWVIGATNRDVSSLKHDFAARLKTVVELPGLNERREDIPLLVRHLVLAFARKNPELAARFVIESPGGRKDVRVDPALIDVLLRRSYTTHVRELETILVEAIAASHGSTIEVYPALVRELEDAQKKLRGPVQKEPVEEVARSEEDEAQLLRIICDGSYGSVTKAAKALGVSRFVVPRMLKRYGIKVPRGGEDE